MNGQEIVYKLKQGDSIALAKAITRVENRRAGYQTILDHLYPIQHKAFKIGVTGAPGSGKSTLIARLISHLCKLGLTVGVLAVDPSSPLSGGALLGDRIRMLEHANNPANA